MCLCCHIPTWRLTPLGYKPKTGHLEEVPQSQEVGRSQPLLPYVMGPDPPSTYEQCSFHPGWLFDIGDDIIPNYMGIIISQYKDPYKPTRIQWKVIHVFFFVAHLFEMT